MKTLVATTTVLAAGFSIFISTISGASTLSPRVAAAKSQRYCPKTFTVHMAKVAAQAVYAGTRDVSMKERRMLGRIEGCQRRRNRHVHRHIASIYKNDRAAWNQRRFDAANPFSSAIASYYTTEGIGACGYGSVQTGYAFASLFLPCGAVVEFCHYGCVEAEMRDHGPYIYSRLFDLNYNLKNAIGCGGICSVRWRRIS